MKPNEEQNQTIIKVCEKLKKRFTFSIYDEDDTFQELYLICLKLMEIWDGRNLENFLTFCACNKMRSFIRSKVGSTSEYVKEQKGILENTINIEHIDELELPHYIFNTDDLSTKVFFDRVEENIPLDLRRDYLKVKTGEYIQTHKKEYIINYIKELYTQNFLPSAFNVGSIEEYTDKYDLELNQIIPFSSGRLGFIDGGYLVEYV